MKTQEKCFQIYIKAPFHLYKEKLRRNVTLVLCESLPGGLVSTDTVALSVVVLWLGLHSVCKQAATRALHATV